MNLGREPFEGVLELDAKEQQSQQGEGFEFFPLEHKVRLPGACARSLCAHQAAQGASNDGWMRKYARAR